MIAIPAVDLREGRCVQLVGGRPEEERVSLPDPVEVARRWWELGFQVLHVVDLDAALDRGDNRAVTERLCSATPATVQVGGGLRDDESVARVLGAGADRVIVGTRAVEDGAWIEALARRYPGRVIVAADVRDGIVLRRGWTESAGLGVAPFLRGLGSLPLAGVLCTDVGREGRMEGIDREGTHRIVTGSPHPVQVSGGISSLAELDALAAMGAAGAVLGMALYTGTLDAVRVAGTYGRETRSGGDA